MTALVLLAGATAPLAAADASRPGGPDPSAVKPYPLDHCLICGDEVGGTNRTVVFVYQGQEMKFCCARCIKQFKQDPAKYLQKLHAAAPADDPTNGTPGTAVAAHD